MMMMSYHFKQGKNKMTIKTITQITEKDGTITILEDESNKLSIPTRDKILHKWYNELLKQSELCLCKEDMYFLMCNLLFQKYDIKLEPFTVRQIVNNKNKRYIQYRKNKSERTKIETNCYNKKAI
jgi:hypothetical protein